MKISEAARVIDASIVCHEDLSSTEIHTACGSDMMSDVMAFYHDGGILLTGLVNIQVIRTVSLLDIQAVCFVRGKKPGQDIMNLAQESNIVVMESELPMFIACGRLYEAGVKGNSQEN